MSDAPKTAADKIRERLAPAAPGTRPPVTSSAPATPAPGFKYGAGAIVIDLPTGRVARVRATYQSASGAGPVYELALSPSEIVVRLEKEIAAAQARSAPPPLLG